MWTLLPFLGPELVLLAFLLQWPLLPNRKKRVKIMDDEWMILSITAETRRAAIRAGLFLSTLQQKQRIMLSWLLNHGKLLKNHSCISKQELILHFSVFYSMCEQLMLGLDQYVWFVIFTSEDGAYFDSFFL